MSFMGLLLFLRCGCKRDAIVSACVWMAQGLLSVPCEQYGAGLPMTQHISYVALATDGDGTLLTHCHLAQRTLRALERLRKAGIKLFLVTGERSDELPEFPGV